MPQFEKHDFLTIMKTDVSLYKFVLALAAQYEGSWYHVGSCCLIAANLALTAKHLVEFMYRHIAHEEIELYNPDVQDSKHGYLFNLPEGLGLDAYQFVDGHKDFRRFSVLGYYGMGYKDTDLILLRIEPHALCPFKDKPREDAEVPIFDLIPPRVGRKVHGFGFPDHPKHDGSKLPDGEHLSDYYLYQSSGVVEAINWEAGSAQHSSYQSSMRTLSGMSGGPVFTEIDGENYCCGIISRGGAVDYSLVSPMWLAAGAQVHPVTDMPVRHGASGIIDLMRAGLIKTVGSERISLLEDKKNNEFVIVADEQTLLREGH